ncbi:MAG: 16S rRNA (guanine(527)-N(7))-methyltransferase RsmG [Blastocatellia bacterium]|nr:MAG: 16S rRNA (guanine(527)-N(7))-methyltransferase RsmG [Blastocatellia bacterium]
MPEPAVEFSSAIIANMSDFGLDISRENLERLADYYTLLLRWNDRLHLVAPCAPEEFAIRHVLESLLLTKHLPSGTTIADVGSGAGLPIIPTMIVRSDIETTLIESSQKKTVFLREAMNQLGLKRGRILGKSFEETATPDVGFISCRALDEFKTKVRTLIAWAPAQGTLLLFGGTGLLDDLPNANVDVDEILIPQSAKRFLFVVRKLDNVDKL